MIGAPPWCVPPAQAWVGMPGIVPTTVPNLNVSSMFSVTGNEVNYGWVTFYGVVTFARNINMAAGSTLTYNGKTIIDTTGAGLAGTPGKDGINGTNGKDGTAGTPGANGIDGKDGAPGPAGKDGVDGQPGKDGQPGAAGQPGQDGQTGPQGPVGPTGAMPNLTLKPGKGIVITNDTFGNYTISIDSTSAPVADGTPQMDTFTVAANQVMVTLTHSPITGSQLLFWKGNYQTPDIDYNLVGQTAAFAAMTPQPGDRITAVYLY